MMKKIINGMFYGSVKTKIFLWSVFAMLLAMCGCGVMAAAAGSFQFALAAVGMAMAALITSQSVSLDELTRPKKEKHEKGKGKNGVKSSLDGKDKTKETDEGEEDEDENQSLKQKNTYLMGMTEKSVKKLLKEHKVPQSHVMVMIDRFPKMNLEQCPAFMWRTETHLHFLTLDRKTGEFEVRLDKIMGIMMLSEVAAEPEDEYLPFRSGGFMAKLFAPYLPDYQEHTKEGKLCFTKNIFQIVPGICFTNKSVSNVMQVLPHIPFLVKDVILQSSSFDEYFKEVYRYGILCKNNVFSLEEYHAKTEVTLQELLTAQMTTEEFVKSLRDMYRYRLIKRDDITRYTQRYQQVRKEMTK